MTCYHPIKAYKRLALTATGKNIICFGKEPRDVLDTLELPCGRCIGCKLQRSLDWASRIEKEASLYDANCFVTLTYAPEHLPPGSTLVLSDHQKFLKRLKSAVAYKFGKAASKKIRFFMCGEYGDKNGRPHYHYCLLNWDFPDKILHRENFLGQKMWRSPMLEELWPYGQSELGSVTFESAAYVARYCTKKITGPGADAHYSCVDVETGELIQRKPEFCKMSLKPGIGRPWFDKFVNDVYNHDKLVIRSGQKMRPPRYFDKQLERIDSSRYSKIRNIRQENELSPIYNRDDWIRKQLDNTKERLIVKEIVQLKTVQSSLNRKFEKE